MRIVKTERKETASKIVNHITIELEQVETMRLGTTIAGSWAESQAKEKEQLAVAIIGKLESACASLL